MLLFLYSNHTFSTDFISKATQVLKLAEARRMPAASALPGYFFFHEKHQAGSPISNLSNLHSCKLYQLTMYLKPFLKCYSVNKVGSPRISYRIANLIVNK